MLRRSRSRSVVAAPSNSSGGNKTSKIRSCESDISMVTPATDAPTPASSNAIVYGKSPTFATTIPTAAAMMNTERMSASNATSIPASTMFPSCALPQLKPLSGGAPPFGYGRQTDPPDSGRGARSPGVARCPPG